MNKCFEFKPCQHIAICKFNQSPTTAFWLLFHKIFLFIWNLMIKKCDLLYLKSYKISKISRNRIKISYYRDIVNHDSGNNVWRDRAPILLVWSADCVWIPAKTDSGPVGQRVRPLAPLPIKKNLRLQLKDWHHDEVIEHSKSPWSSPLVPVTKKSGRVRWCWDFRAVIKITIDDSYPRHIELARLVKTFFNFRCGSRVSCNFGRRKIPFFNSICYSLWAIPIRMHALWHEKCRGSVLMSRLATCWYVGGGGNPCLSWWFVDPY